LRCQQSASSLEIFLGDLQLDAADGIRQMPKVGNGEFIGQHAANASRIEVLLHQRRLHGVHERFERDEMAEHRTHLQSVRRKRTKAQSSKCTKPSLS
jgi:hypothetical protein